MKHFIAIFTVLFGFTSNLLGYNALELIVPLVDSGCTNTWVPYNNDNVPETDGVNAGPNHCGNAYVGKVQVGGLWKPGRLQTTENTGVYTCDGGLATYTKTGGEYLKNNPAYTYSWVDYDGVQIPSNAVTIRPSGGAMNTPITRLVQNGDTEVGQFGSGLAIFASEDLTCQSHTNFQVLVCEPQSTLKCAPVWKVYTDDSEPSTDGFWFAKRNGNDNYIGRTVGKCIKSCSNIVGRFDMTYGVFYLDPYSASERLNQISAEYLYKEPSGSYDWVISNDGIDVKNAIKFVKNAKLTVMIGKTQIGNDVFIGEVYPGIGLVFADADGQKSTVSVYSVLTCIA